MLIERQGVQARFESMSIDGSELCAVFNSEGQKESVYFRSEDIALSARAEALAVAGLLPAMRRGVPLELDSALDPVFAANLSRVQLLLSGWNDAFSHVKILDAQREPSVPEQSHPRVGLFFSGGVDSFYTLLTHQDEITDLIFVHGFDIRPEEVEHARLAEASIRRIGAQFGKRVVKVETNLRSFLDGYAAWDVWAHGAALAAVAHLLANELGRIYIAASDSGSELAPRGSHPDLDPLWSRSGLTFFHDGVEATRLEKVRHLATSEVALQNLRVCWKNRVGTLNCGRCEKCIRTMIGLTLVGAMDRCLVFARPFRCWRVCLIKIAHPNVETGQLSNLDALRKMPEQRGLYYALSIAFWRSRVREFCKR